MLAMSAGFTGLRCTFTSTCTRAASHGLVAVLMRGRLQTSFGTLRHISNAKPCQDSLAHPKLLLKGAVSTQNKV
jgi:hypothetical protein